jgi:intein/homing endonuclease
MDKATAEKMVKDFSRLVRRHMAEEDDPDGNYEYEKEVKRKMEQAAESIVEALTTPPAKPQGEVSVETAFAEGYYVGFADGVGPGLELEAAWDNFKKKFQPTVAARVPPEADHLPDPKKVIPPKLSEAIAWATDHLENTGHDDDERFIYLKSLHTPAVMQSKQAEPLHEAKPPKRIYLQNEGDGYDPVTWEGASWCQDRIEETDAEYIRADLPKSLLEAAKTLKREVDRYANMPDTMIEAAKEAGEAIEAIEAQGKGEP